MLIRSKVFSMLSLASILACALFFAWIPVTSHAESASELFAPIAAELVSIEGQLQAFNPPITVFANNMGQGLSSGEVSLLQLMLMHYGFYTGSITGSFDALTKGAVVSFQSKNNVPGTGFVGPMTRAALDRIMVQEFKSTAASQSGTSAGTNSASPASQAPMKEPGNPGVKSGFPVSSGSTVSGTITFSPGTTGLTLPINFTLNFDGNEFGLSPKKNTTSSYVWDTTDFQNGSHVIFLKATDSAGEVVTSTPVKLTINNVPVFSGGNSGSGSAPSSPSNQPAQSAPPTPSSPSTPSTPSAPTPSPQYPIPQQQGPNITLTSCEPLTVAGTYVLENDVSSVGTCFSVVANGVTLNLNGHTVTYGNGPAITATNNGFENGAAGWDLSGAPNASVMQGNFLASSVYDGTHALAVTEPSAAQTIKSSAFTLPGGHTYVVSTMYFNQIGDDNVKLTMEVDNAKTGSILSTATYSGQTWRGFEMRFPNSIYVATDTSAMLKITVDGSSATHSGTVYLDDIEVHIASSWGVAMIASWAGPYKLENGSVYRDPDFSYASDPNNPMNLVVENGTIKSGTGKPFNGTGIQLGTNIINAEIANNTIIVNGINAQAIDGDSNGLNIHDNTLVGTAVASNGAPTAQEFRDYYLGYAVITDGDGLKFERNKISNFSQGALAYYSGKNGMIDNNDISWDGFFTNDFGVLVDSPQASNNRIFDNYIHPVSGRGIHVAGSNNLIYDNTINITELKQNQEYGGCQVGGAYGIQIEGEQSGNEVYGNHVTASSDQCDGVALRFTDLASTDTATIHDNTFTGVKSGSGPGFAYSVNFSAPNGTGVSMENNTFTADSANVHWDWDSFTNFTFASDTFAEGSNPIAYHTFSGRDAADSVDNIFLNDSFINGASPTDASFGKLLADGWEHITEYFVNWTLQARALDVLGRPVQGAAVSIKNKNGTTVFTGTTDANGYVSAPVNEIHAYNTASTDTVVDDFDPFTITMTSGSVSGSYALSVDSPQSVVVKLQ